jgi:xylulokinase
LSLLALDIGSSSIKAAILKNRSFAGRPTRIAYATLHEGSRVEVDAETLLLAISKAITDLGPRVKRVDAIALSVMSPAWVAMDKRGRALTPIVTHQDRRSVQEAVELEKRVGRARHLAIAGNRPFPGSISSTTLAWFLRHEPGRMARAELIGHVNTLLHRRLTGSRVIDPSNASFTGLYCTCDLSGWSDELCRAVGIRRSLLPEVTESNATAGFLTDDAANTFGLRAGTPVTAGMVDTGAAMMVTGSRIGQLFHMCGSTDVLAVVASRARPHERLLTRALGIGRKWLSVYTLAAVGSSFDWARRQFFRDLSDDHFRSLVNEIWRSGRETSAKFDPYLAGERASMEQRQAAFSGLTLATMREDLLAAMVQSLRTASVARLELLHEAEPHFLPTVYFSGRQRGLADAMHRDWPRRWKYRHVEEASLRGLGQCYTETQRHREERREFSHR